MEIQFLKVYTGQLYRANNFGSLMNKRKKQTEVKKKWRGKSIGQRTSEPYQLILMSGSFMESNLYKLQKKIVITLGKIQHVNT